MKRLLPIKKRTRRLFFFLLLLLLAFLLLTPGKGRPFGRLAPKEPHARLEEALAANRSAGSYRFVSRSTLNVSGKERVFSEIEGEVAGSSAHLRGSILGEDVEIFRTEDGLICRDAISGAWREAGAIASDELLAAELDPLVNFRFLDTGEVRCTARGGGRCRLEFSPQMESEWIRAYFGEITFAVVVNEKSGFLEEACISARMLEAPDTELCIETVFSELNGEIEIHAPALPAKSA